MPYHSQQLQDKHEKQDLFDYVMQSMEKPMNSEDDVFGYYDQFRELAKPLFKKHWLNKDEGDVLFWYGFHPEDHAMILCRLHHRCLGQQARPSHYFHTQQTYLVAHKIFAQKTRDLHQELDQALE
jgi:hypothetical protein